MTAQNDAFTHLELIRPWNRIQTCSKNLSTYRFHMFSYRVPELLSTPVLRQRHQPWSVPWFLHILPLTCASPPAPHLHYSSLYLGPVLSSACVGLSVVFARSCCWFLIRLPPLIFLHFGPASFALSVTASLFYMILNWFPLNFKHSTGQKKQFFRWHLGLGELVKAYFSIFWHLTE